MKRIFLPLLVLLGTYSVSQAQFKYVNRLALETNMGFAIGHTDIANSAIGVGMQIGASYSLLRSMALCMNITYSSISSPTDDYNRGYQSNVIGTQFEYEVNIPQLLTDYPQSFPVSPYVRFGAGFAVSQPIYVKFGDAPKAYSYPESLPTSTSYTAVTVPTSVGAYFRLNQYIDVNLRINYVYTNSDMIDGHLPNVLGNQYNDSYSQYLIGLRLKSWDRRRPFITGK